MQITRDRGLSTKYLDYDLQSDRNAYTCNIQSHTEIGRNGLNPQTVVYLIFINIYEYL